MILEKFLSNEKRDYVKSRVNLFNYYKIQKRTYFIRFDYFAKLTFFVTLLYGFSRSKAPAWE